MDFLRPFVAASVVTLTVVGAGHAADLTILPPSNSLILQPWPVADYAPRNILMSGWYLRGDCGFRWDSHTSADAASGFISPTDNSSGSGVVLSLGAGFRSNWLRGDVAVNYAVAQKYQATLLTSDGVTAKIQTNTALQNIYADLSTWYRLTHYIGAGIGAARVTVSDFDCAVSPPFSGSSAYSQWNLARAAMASTAFATARNLKIDIGYRYLNFGNAQSSDGPGGHMTFKNLVAQEARIGLRWS
jgi:opacity protein-like surface antigen